MSFKEEKRESIKRYLLDKVAADDSAFIQKTVENFSISITTVKRYLAECLEDEILKKSDTVTGYELVTEQFSRNYEQKEFLTEDRIYFEDIRPHLTHVTNEALQIWDYVFMEMMNNAIEHSKGTQISVEFKKNYLFTEIAIADDGIGIFQNICNYLTEKFQYSALYEDAVTELYKGKLTTNPTYHSGEGVFFSSKMMQNFVIWSDNTIFSTGFLEKDKLVQSHLISYYTRLQKIGTMVVMRLENQAARKIKEVFDMYAPVDEGFVKTVIPIREVCPYGEPIARSQARRILFRLEKFKEVELDFTGIEFMGQGFADEIFRVFQNKHPELVLKPIHANESVLGMVKHVRVNLEQTV